MLRKILDYKLSLTEKGKPLHKFRPLVTALDTFMYEPAINTSRGPHIRDAVDAKRWMILVVFALIPVLLVAMWNTGVQKLVYTSGSYGLMNDYLAASNSFGDYMEFCLKDSRWLNILVLGGGALLPVLVISYAVGGLWEGLFACIRGHEIAEGFLVTGVLYALILPPTIPYWMVAFGVSAGVVIGKELFGGSGMNILNPAMTCRAFLFFTFPGKMTGDVWVGTNPTVVKDSLLRMNAEAGTGALDGYTQATPLGVFNVSDEIKRVHVDAIASNTVGDKVGTYEVVQRQFEQWNTSGVHNATLGQLTPDQMREFVTAPMDAGGLALGAENYQAAYDFSSLQYGIGKWTDGNFFFGNQLGCMGETSTFACLLGAIFLIWVGVGAWRTMLGLLLSAFCVASLFQICGENLGVDSGAWNPAKYGFPAYKHLLIGGLAFGLVFMATDPVSSPGINGAKWVYGALIGAVVIIIRAVNPAYPEGMMLAVLFGNVFAPLIDHYAVRAYRRKRRVAV